VGSVAMDNNESWKSDLRHLGLLMGLCLLIGIYLIWQTVLISPDGVFYITQAQEFALPSSGVAQRCPAGYPFVLWLAHRAATLFTGHDSAMLWIHSSQSVTLLLRVLAVVPLYFLGRLFVGPGNSFWALLLLIVLPYPARYGSDVLREWPYLLFLGLGFWLLCWGLRHRQWWVLALVGLDAGLGYTIRPECAQLVIYAFLGLACLGAEGILPLYSGRDRIKISQSEAKMASRRKGGTPSPRNRRTLWGAGAMLTAGLLVPVVPYVWATGSVMPHQLRPATFNAPPVISAIGPNAASSNPLEFEVAEGDLLELPIKAADPHGDPLRFSLVGIPTDSRPIYEFRSRSIGDCIWTVSEDEKDQVLATYSREVWEYAGLAGYAYVQSDARPGLLLVRRFWLPPQQRHLYTTDEAEVRTIVEKSPPDSWSHEGVAYYAFGPDDHPSDTVPVYRFGSREEGCSWVVGADRGKKVRTSEGEKEKTGTVVWYVHLGGEPPAGAVIESGVLRWRPGPGQKGDYQVNIIVSDGELECCQLMKIRVTPRRMKDRGQKTEDGGQRTNDGIRPFSVLRPPSAGFSGLRAQQAGVAELPKATVQVFTAVAKDLMIVLAVPWVLGLYYRFRYQAERVERTLMAAVVIVNLALMLGRHIALEAGGDRRYSLGLIALTIFYVPTGMEVMARWLAQWKWPALPRWPWFHLLVAVGIVVCLPKVLIPTRGARTGYRAAAAWLQQNTKADDVVAVPDSRISFYAQRQGLFYRQHPNSRRADYVVMTGHGSEMEAPQEWHREYATTVDRRNREALVIYSTSRAKR